jgi:glycyl-tRNA synthetase beta chain
MPEFLIELFSEEIPARMQAQAAEELRQRLLELAKEGGEGASVDPATIATFVTPRRIAGVIADLPAVQPARSIERKGPRVGAPEQSVQGFLAATGLPDLAASEIREIGNAKFYFAVQQVPGRATIEVLREKLPELVRSFPWPKSMRWGYGTARWVRPLHRILAVFGGEPVGGAIGFGSSDPARAEIAVRFSNLTEGHRFLGPGPIEVRDFAGYRRDLLAAKVMIDPAERKAKILADAEALAAPLGLRLRPDAGLLEEVAGLVEWPVVRIGRIKADFMALPPEVLTTSMRTHQKYFACEAVSDGTLAPYFIVVGNNETRDGGAQMIAGNEKVLRARLSDAQFFWDQDRQATLESRVGKLEERVFHAKLGTVLGKVRRMAALAPVLCSHVPQADAALAQRAVMLAKADLSSAMVGEFPELQGVVGRYLARHDGENDAVAEAVARHYSPVGLDDSVPREPIAIIAALADKVDTLAGFFAISERPTGSKDPYALRRAALGIIRIIIENGLRVPLRTVFAEALAVLSPSLASQGIASAPDEILDGLLDFFADRLKVALREQGVRHDLISAVFALGGEDDLVRLATRTRALQAFLASDDGASLLIAYRRAYRIVQIEAKKEGVAFDAAPDPSAMELPQEHALYDRLELVEAESRSLLAAEDFAGAMAALARLRRPVDDFFENVTVNAEQPTLRLNRLRILGQIWRTLNKVADFSKIEG